jgi:two-component system response regulator YesN
LRAWLGQRYPDDLAIAKHQAYELLALVRRQTQAVQPDFGGFSVWKDTWRRMAALADAAAVAAYALAGLDECIGVMAERRRGRTGPAVNKAKAVIQENLAADLTLDEVARRVEASPFYFSKLFRDETGEDFADYLAAARMRKAKELLLEPSVPVKDIAAAVGYADPNQFSKAFKKAFGQTPTEFRENQ